MHYSSAKLCTHLSDPWSAAETERPHAQRMMALCHSLVLVPQKQTVCSFLCCSSYCTAETERPRAQRVMASCHSLVLVPSSSAEHPGEMDIIGDPLETAVLDVSLRVMRVALMAFVVFIAGQCDLTVALKLFQYVQVVTFGQSLALPRMITRF